MGLILIPQVVGYWGEYSGNSDEIIKEIFGEERPIKTITARDDILREMNSPPCEFLRNFFNGISMNPTLKYYLSILGKGEQSYGIMYASSIIDEDNLGTLSFMVIGDNNLVYFVSESLKDGFQRATGNRLESLNPDYLESLKEKTGLYNMFINSADKKSLEKAITIETTRVRRLLEEPVIQ